jgi:hypothetical protein
MKSKILKLGGAYLAYEIGSTLLLFLLAARGLDIPGY